MNGWCDLAVQDDDESGKFSSACALVSVYDSKGNIAEELFNGGMSSERSRVDDGRVPLIEVDVT